MSIPIPAAGGLPVPANLGAPASRPATAPAIGPVIGTSTGPATGLHKRWAGLRRWKLRSWLILGAAALMLVTGAVILVRRLMTPPPSMDAVATEAVSRQDISQTVEATGTVQAINVVEIKSKASGQILKMPVVIGSMVKAGDLLVQIDPLTVRNQYNQSLAAQQAAAAQVEVTTAQKLRADVLFSQEAMTAPDHEAAVLAIANAKAALAKAGSDLQIARQALGDATVRAPSAGRIVEQTATQGMVITSATSGASGGTTILKMADLNQIEINALVAETDVGNLAPGMPARVTVDAFPSRPFAGHVTMIEPQAVVQQSVTLFPVLVAIHNENGTLLPGMNGEVTISIASRTQALAVPLDAIRTLREAPTVALSLGLDPDSTSARLQRQFDARSAARASAPAATAAATARSPGAAAHRRPGGAAGSGHTRVDAAAPGATRAARAQFVVVRTATGLEPRLVSIGISDFDYSEVLGGLKEGELVVLLSVAEQTAKRKSQQAQMSQRAGNGLPGSAATTGGGRPGGGGPGSGGGR